MKVFIVVTIHTGGQKIMCQRIKWSQAAEPESFSSASFLSGTIYGHTDTFLCKECQTISSDMDCGCPNKGDWWPVRLFITELDDKDNPWFDESLPSPLHPDFQDPPKEVK